MPVHTFDHIVANSIVGRDLNRVRINALLEKDRQIADLGSQLQIKTNGEANAKLDAANAWKKVEECQEVNSDLTRKNKRLRPWATFGKVTVAFGVVGIAVAGVELMKNSVE